MQKFHKHFTNIFLWEKYVCANVFILLHMYASNYESTIFWEPRHDLLVFYNEYNKDTNIIYLM